MPEETKKAKVSEHEHGPEHWHEWRKEWHRHWSTKWRHFSLGCGSLLIVIGFFWFIKELGLMPSIPLWPIIVLLVGLWITIASILKGE